MVEETPPEETAPSPEKKGLSPFVIVGIVVLGGTLILLAGLGVLGGLAPGALAILRDIAIVCLGILVLFSALLLLYLLAALIVAINRLSDRIDELLQRGGAVLDQVKGTATTVKGTTEFVGERVASPFIGFSSWAAGVGRGLAAFFRRQENKGGSS